MIVLVVHRALLWLFLGFFPNVPEQTVELDCAFLEVSKPNGLATAKTDHDAFASLFTETDPADFRIRDFGRFEQVGNDQVFSGDRDSSDTRKQGTHHERQEGHYQEQVTSGRPLEPHPENRNSQCDN